MTEFYKAMKDLGVEEAEERDQALDIVQKARERERQLKHRKETDDMDTFIKLVQLDRTKKACDNGQSAGAEAEGTKDEYPCVRSALLGFAIGVLTAALFLFIYRVS